MTSERDRLYQEELTRRLRARAYNRNPTNLDRDLAGIHLTAIELASGGRTILGKIWNSFLILAGVLAIVAAMLPAIIGASISILFVFGLIWLIV